MFVVICCCPKLAKAILIIPHGNAEVECIFNQLGLNKRNQLGMDTLTSLLILQINHVMILTQAKNYCVNAITKELTS